MTAATTERAGRFATQPSAVWRYRRGGWGGRACGACGIGPAVWRGELVAGVVVYECGGCLEQSCAADDDTPDTPSDEDS